MKVRDYPFKIALFHIMKVCDICSKPTNFLEDLDYCMVCSDCYIEITTEENELNKYLNEDKKDDNRDNE